MRENQKKSNKASIHDENGDSSELHRPIKSFTAKKSFMAKKSFIAK